MEMRCAMDEQEMYTKFLFQKSHMKKLRASQSYIGLCCNLYLERDCEYVNSPWCGEMACFCLTVIRVSNEEFHDELNNCQVFIFQLVFKT